MMKKISEKGKPEKLQRYVNFMGFSKNEINDAVEKLEKLKAHSIQNTERKDKAYSAARKPASPVVDSTFEDETELRRRVHHSYTLARVAPPPQSDPIDFIERNRQILNHCVAMMETLPEDRLLQFQNTMSVTRKQLDEAIIKFDLKEKLAIKELAIAASVAVAKPATLPKAKPVKRPSIRFKQIAESLAKPVVIPKPKPEPIIVARPAITPIKETKKAPAAAIYSKAVTESAPPPQSMVRSMFTRVLRSFGFSSTPDH